MENLTTKWEAYQGDRDARSVREDESTFIELPAEAKILGYGRPVN